MVQIMQSIGFLGPAFFLTQLSHVRTPALAVLCMACSQVRHAFHPIYLCSTILSNLPACYFCYHFPFGKGALYF